MSPRRRYTLAELLAGSTPEDCPRDDWDNGGLAFGREFGAEAGGFAPVGREFGAPGWDSVDPEAPEGREED